MYLSCVELFFEEIIDFYYWEILERAFKKGGYFHPKKLKWTFLIMEFVFKFRKYVSEANV